MDPSPRPILPAALLLLWAVAVGSITLTPGAPIEWWNAVDPGCVVCGTRGSADAVLNIVLFLPLGALLRTWLPPLRTLAVGVLVSTAIELVQWVIPGRYPTVGDVIWNATGVGVGLGMAVILRRVVGRRPASLPAVGLALALPFVYLSLSGWLLAPRETDRLYFGQLTPDLGFMPPYRGELLSARSSGGPVPDGPWTGSARLREGVTWWIEAEVEVGPRPASVSPVVGVADASRQEILLLGIMEDDLVWRERTLANALRFDRPDQRLRGGLAGRTEGDTVTLAVRADGVHRCLRVGDEEACGLGVTPGGTWGMLMYLEGASRAQRRVLDVAWMATLFVLVGLVGGGWRGTTVSALGGAVLVGVAVVPTRLLPPDGLELVGLAAGVLAGVALRGAVRLVLGSQRQGGGGGAPL